MAINSKCYEEHGELNTKLKDTVYCEMSKSKTYSKK